jgi:hypothetical protein
MHKINIDNQKCPLCNSMETESKAIFNGRKYQISTKCNNPNCISNKLDQDFNNNLIKR